MSNKSKRLTLDDFGETLKIRDVAAVYDLSENHVRGLIRKNQFPGVIRLGRRIVISKRALERHLNGEEK